MLDGLAVELLSKLRVPLGLAVVLLGSGRRTVGLSFGVIEADLFLVVARVVAGHAAAVGDVIEAVEAEESVGEDADDLNDVVEAVVAGLALEPRRVVGRADVKGSARAERGAEGQQRRGEDDEAQLELERSAAALGMALAKRVRLLAAGDERGGQANGDGQEGEHREKDDGKELDVADAALGVGVEGVEAVDDGDDDHDERGANHGVEGAEGVGDGAGPAETRVVGADDAVDEDEVDDEEEDDAGVGEDAGGDGDGGVLGAAGPDDAHDVGGDAGHGEAEDHAGEGELVAAPEVALQDGHVEHGGGDEDGDEDGRDGHVETDGRVAAEACTHGGIGRSLFCC